MTGMFLHSRIFLVCIAMLTCFSAKAQLPESWTSWWYNSKALKSLLEPDLNKAKEHLQQGMMENGLNPVLQYNMGEILEQVKDFEKAARHFELAARLTNDKELKFQSLFNAGSNLAQDKKVAEALKAYQEALSIKPDSVEVKTNIELLLSSQGGGGGQGDSQEQKDPQQGDQNQQNQNNGKPDQKKPKNQPRQFKSEDLSEQEVRRILDELKRQEEKIRGKELKKPQKESPNDKDW